MKKLLLLSVIALSSMCASAQLIEVKQGFGMEYFTSNKTAMFQDIAPAPNSGIKSYKNRIVFDKGSFACLYKLKFSYDSFSINALTSIYMNKGQSYKFAPSHAEFTINLKYDYKKLSFKVEHQCVHDIISKNIPPVQLQGGYTKIGIYFGW